MLRLDLEKCLLIQHKMENEGLRGDLQTESYEERISKNGCLREHQEEIMTLKDELDYMNDMLKKILEVQETYSKL